ncbi:50S ribosomal protein L12P domain protein [Actinomyces sp. oral taxon 170 str. F0386]|nr:50S ribosomal protein L12P domain protein [Actinomyces sp. oral taxon 170 str. F0386]
MAALHASCQPMTAPVSPQATSSTRQPHPIGVIVCSSQRSGRSAVATASVSRDLAGRAVRAVLADADDAADAEAFAEAADVGDAAGAAAPEDPEGVAAEGTDAPARPADPGRSWRAELCDVV